MGTGAGLAIRGHAGTRAPERPCRSGGLRPAFWGGLQVWLALALACLVRGATAADAASAATRASADALPAVAGSRPLRIGLLVPPDESLGVSLRRGAKLAAARLGEVIEGGVELVVRGRVGQWGDDGDEAGRLVMDDGARVLVAPPGGVATHLVLQVAGRTRTPVILLCPDGSVTSAGVPWVLRLVPSATRELAALLGPGPTRVLVPEGRPARELAGDLERWRARAAVTPRSGGLGGVEVSPVSGLPPGDGPNGKERFLDGLVRTDQSILLWLDPPTAAAWARKLRDAGFRGVLGGPGWLRSPGFVEAAGRAALGFRVPEPDPSGWSEDSRRGLRAFVEDFRKANGLEPDAAAVAAADAVGLAAALVRSAGDRPLHTRFPIQDGLGHGLTGLWRFDRSGNREDLLRVVSWNGSGWHPEPGGR